MKNNLKIIIVSGLPGTGKSTLAEAVARQLGYTILSVDPIESAIIKSGIKRSFETGLAAYLVAESLADEQLKLGNSLIIDAVNPVPQARQAWRDLAQKYTAHLVVIECILDKNLHKERLESRVRNLHGIEEVTWDNVENLLKEYTVWENEKLVIDTASNPKENLEKVVKYLNEV